MDQEKYRSAALFEHRFWLQVLGDHARFIFLSLPANEPAEIQTTTNLMHVFDTLLYEARRDLSLQEIVVLNPKAYQATQELKAFKLHLLRRSLVGKININLSQSIFSHMINELEEYVIILNALLIEQLPPLLPAVHYHEIWLLDAYGHANILHDKLDLAESALKNKISIYSAHFNGLYLKAVELAGYMRANLQHFPALSKFNSQVNLELHMFIKFLKELEEMELTNEMLGTLFPLLLQHMSREECYFLIKLSQVSQIQRPDCDPTRPRIDI